VIELDKIDRLILSLMQENADLSTSDIAERVNLTQPPCWRRIKRLEKDGYILKRSTVLEPSKLGLNLVIYAEAKLTANRELSAFENSIKDIPEVMECYVMLGRSDFLLRIITTDIKAYEQLYREKLSRLPDVQEITSSVAMGEVKRSFELPLHLL